ncbi:MAG TPA: UDPGP type 1 family protein [Candidatus Hydrogenedentes bacterium]|nr:UDPGP type 1 family protein [Candidatus Hydrogenedentota bacterium]HQH52206.1 UDPGP type 1 family protein [Candidatus Hydrogenedentota bacterium]
MITESAARQRLEEHGQEHVLRFWAQLSNSARENLLAQIGAIDFRLINRLIERWVKSEPPEERFDRIEPVPLIPQGGGKDARDAWNAGEEALRQGRVGLLLVAGGQGTRLGFGGPKGAYPIGPITKKSIFCYHAEKIRNLQRRYKCVLPWYIMVSDANHASTQAFFEQNRYFGLEPANVLFFEQRMVPCIDQNGKFMLDEPGALAMNPNGHGGVIPALVDNGIAEDARNRGIDTLSYFQVDNWAVKLADPLFIGYHVMRNARMSSKNHRKNRPCEAVGVHCVCDGVYRVIEYTMLDMYPQLLETDAAGNLIHSAGNPAIHIIDVGFIEKLNASYDDFPWWRAHKKIPCVNDQGERIEPAEPNGYKFETFIFDALRFIGHEPVALEIPRAGEYTPIKAYEGDNSVVAARESMRNLWGGWFEKAGFPVRRDAAEKVAVDIEISPGFALDENEFIERAKGHIYDALSDIAIGPGGNIENR